VFKVAAFRFDARVKMSAPLFVCRLSITRWSSSSHVHTVHVNAKRQHLDVKPWFHVKIKLF